MSLRDILDAALSEREDEPSYFRLLRAHHFEAAVPVIRQAMTQNDGQAMGFYASLLVTGQGVAKDLEQAVDWFREGAILGDVFCQTALGVCLSAGIGLDVDSREAAFWLYVAACAGQPLAISLLSDVVGLDPGLVGIHFTIEQYLDLMTQLRRPRVVH
jgi:hypothetical protein